MNVKTAALPLRRTKKTKIPLAHDRRALVAIRALRCPLAVKAALRVLATQLNTRRGDWSVWCGERSLARAMGCVRDTARNALLDAVTSGYLAAMEEPHEDQRDGRYGRPSAHFRVNISALEEGLPFRSERPKRVRAARPNTTSDGMVTRPNGGLVTRPNGGLAARPEVVKDGEAVLTSEGASPQPGRRGEAAPGPEDQDPGGFLARYRRRERMTERERARDMLADPGFVEMEPGERAELERIADTGDGGD